MRNLYQISGRKLFNTPVYFFIFYETQKYKKNSITKVENKKDAKNKYFTSFYFNAFYLINQQLHLGLFFLQDLLKHPPAQAR